MWFNPNLQSNLRPNLVDDTVWPVRHVIFLLDGGATRTITVRGTNLAKLYVDYGDGSAIATITLLGSGTDVNISHLYAAGVYRMLIYGDHKEVSLINGDTEGIQSADISIWTEVTVVRMSANDIIDISFLRELHGVSDLQMFSNEIVDMSPVASIGTPGGVRLYDNNIVDMSAVRNLTSLTVLMLHSNSIEDCSAIENLSNLTYCRLYSNSITTLPTTFPAWDSCEVRIDNNGLGFPTDECLEKMAASGMTNNAINISGSNPARTQPGTDAYVATILGNGNTLAVN